MGCRSLLSFLIGIPYFPLGLTKHDSPGSGHIPGGFGSVHLLFDKPSFSFIRQESVIPGVVPIPGATIFGGNCLGPGIPKEEAFYIYGGRGTSATIESKRVL